MSSGRSGALHKHSFIDRTHILHELTTSNLYRLCLKQTMFINSVTGASYTHWGADFLLLCPHAQQSLTIHRGLVWSSPANAFWLLIYLISSNRWLIEIHQKFLSVHSPPGVSGLSAPARAPLPGVLAGPLSCSHWQSISHWDNQPQDTVWS